MIKAAALVSLFVVMLNQAHATAFKPDPWDVCLFSKPLKAVDLARIGTDSHLINHLKTNASKASCVKEIHKDFFKSVTESEKTVLEYLRGVNTLKDIPASIVKDFNEATCTAFVGANNASRMTIEQIKVLPNGCLNNNARIGEMSRAQVQAIVPKTEGKGVPAKAFLAHENFRTQMTDTQLKAAAGNEFAGCRELTPTTLSKINPATLANLDYRCFNNVKWKKLGAETTEPSGATDPATLQKIAHYVGPAAFKDLSRVTLPDGLYESLKPSHLKTIDTLNGEERCAKVPLQLLQSHFAGYIDSVCFKNAFERLPVAGVKGLEPDFFINAKDDLFSAFKDSGDFVKLKHIVNSWSALSGKHYADILKHDTDICKEIEFSDKAKAFAYASELGAECFAKMNADTQNLILTLYTLLLKEDVLSKLDGTHGTHLEGSIKVVAATRPALLKHFGAGDVNATENVCGAYDVTKLKDPAGLKRAARHFPKNCLVTMINETGEKVQYTELSEYPDNFVALLDVPKLLENLSESSLRELDSELKWKAFIGPTVCKALSWDKFDKVPSNVSYPFITTTCLDALTFLDTLSSSNADDIKKIPPTIIAAAQPATIGALATALGDNQLKVLGANASGLGDEAFDKLTVAQIGALSAQGVAGLTVGAFKAIKEETKWLAVKPESLTLIKYEQLNAVPEAILLKTSEKQAKEIPAAAACAFTKERRSKLSAPVHNALKPLPEVVPPKK